MADSATPTTIMSGLLGYLGLTLSSGLWLDYALVALTSLSELVFCQQLIQRPYGFVAPCHSQQVFSITLLGISYIL